MQIAQRFKTAMGIFQTMQTCPDCGGTGRIVEPCPVCGGDGRIKGSKKISNIGIPAGRERHVRGTFTCATCSVADSADSC